MSPYAKHHNHTDYVNSVLAEITPLTKRSSNSTLTAFANSIINDPHAPGVIAKCPPHPALQNHQISQKRSNCSLCRSSGCFAPSPQAAQNYVQSMRETFERLDPNQEQALNAHKQLAKRIQNDTHFPALVASYPIVLSYLPPTRNANLAVIALDNIVDFLRSQPDPAAMEVDDDTELAETIATFYVDLIREHLGDNEAVIVAALKAEQQCRCSDLLETPIYDAVLEVIQDEDITPNIAKYLINANPAFFFSVEPSLQSNLELICSVLPNHPFLYYALPSNIQRHMQYVPPSAPTITDARKAEVNFERAVTYCDPDLIEGEEKKMQDVIQCTYQETMTMLNNVQGNGQEIGEIRRRVEKLLSDFRR